MSYLCQVEYIFTGIRVRQEKVYILKYKIPNKNGTNLVSGNYICVYLIQCTSIHLPLTFYGDYINQFLKNHHQILSVKKTYVCNIRISETYEMLSEWQHDLYCAVAAITSLTLNGMTNDNM